MLLRLLPLLSVLVACQEPAATVAVPADAGQTADTTLCTVLFGVPNDKTGLTAAQ